MTTPSNYMKYGNLQPGFYDGTFGPMSAEIKADIEIIRKHLATCPDTGSTEHGDVEAQAFNRLMAELHITTASSSSSLGEIHSMQVDLSYIDKALDAVGIPNGATVDRVNAAIKRANDVEAAAPQALAAVRACAQVLSGDGLSKSLLVRALEMCRTVMQRANGEGKGL